MHDLIMGAELLVCHLLVAMAWYFPVRRLAGCRCKVQALSAAYLLNGVLMIGLAIALDLSGIYRISLFWGIWGTCCIAANGMAMRRVNGLRQEKEVSWKVMWIFIVSIVIGLYVRMADPILNHSFACMDVYKFYSALLGMRNSHAMITTYPAGLSLWIGHLQWRWNDPMALVRFSPQMIAVWGLASGFGFWKSMFGVSAALLSTILLAGSVWLFPVLIQHTLYPPMTTLALTLAPLYYAVPRLLSGEGRNWRAMDLGIASLLLLAMTGTVYAVFATCLAGMWGGCVLIRKKAPWIAWARFSPLLLIAPAFVLFYYQVALPIRLPTMGVNVAVQSRQMLGLVETVVNSGAEPVVRRSLYEIIAGADRIPPFLRSIATFWMPNRFEFIRQSTVETIFMILSFGCGVALCRTRHRAAGPYARFVGFSILVCLLSSATGMLELPGFQGRALYFMVWLTIPAASFLFIHSLLPRLIVLMNTVLKTHLVRKNGQHLAYVLAMVSCIPTLINPPVAGKNVHPPVTIARQIPDDNILTAFFLDPHRNTRDSLLIIADEFGALASGDALACVVGLRALQPRLQWVYESAYAQHPPAGDAMDLYLLCRRDQSGRLESLIASCNSSSRTWRPVAQTDRMVLMHGRRVVPGE